MDKVLKNTLVFVFMFGFFVPTFSLASNTNGTIDSTFRYAWGENIGFVDFGSSAGNVHITDSAISGSFYGENIGWIDLSTITNNNEGVLSGYAWGENVGWVDFSKVTIGSDGVFSGSAYNGNVGWITFGAGDNKVVTDWRPLSARPRRHGGGRPIIIPLPATPPTISIPSATPTVPVIPPIIIPTTPPSAPLLNDAGGNFCSFCIPTFNNGSKGEPVKELQIFLNKALKSNLAVDGKLGPKTFAVIKKWQKANGLKADGFVGPATKAKMNFVIINK
ncbi:MAG: peptidoglycan-binding domain-containing protein [Candidatus Nomurabacteria bacterium]|nr:peptidoglycan-binding domain-containing protein [Candidatus Nomurabacteria bacterium]